MSAAWLFTAMALIVRRVRAAPSTPNIKKDGALRKYTVAGYLGIRATDLGVTHGHFRGVGEALGGALVVEEGEPDGAFWDVFGDFGAEV